jgi:hypothetical protein
MTRHGYKGISWKNKIKNGRPGVRLNEPSDPSHERWKDRKTHNNNKKRIEKKMSRYKCVKTSRQPGALWYRVSNLIALLFLVVKRWQQIPLCLSYLFPLSLIQFMLIVFMRQQGENWDRSPLSLPFFVLFSEEKPAEGGTWAVTEFFIINFVFSSGVGRGDEKVNRHKHPAALRETFFSESMRGSFRCLRVSSQENKKKLKYYQNFLLSQVVLSSS